MVMNYNWVTPNPKVLVMEPSVKEEKTKIDEHYPRSQLIAILKVLSLDQSAKDGKIKKLYHLASIAFSIVSVILSLKSRFTYIYIHLPKVVAFMDVLSFINMFIMCLYNMTFSTFCNQQLCGNSYDNFRTVDNLLGTNKPGIFILLRKFITQLLVLVITILIIIFSFDFYTWTTSYDYIHSVTYSLNYFYFFVNTLASINFVISLYYLWGKFYIVNTQLKAHFELVHNDKKSQSDTHYLIKPNKGSVFANLILKRDLLERLGEEAVHEKPFCADSFMKAYMILCDQADHYNYNFSFQNLLASTSGLFSIIRSVRIVLLYAANETETFQENSSINPMITMINFAMFDILILLLITIACEHTTSEATKISLVLDTILYNGCAEQNQKLEAWSQLMTRRTPKFTACKLFPIDYTLLYNLTGTVVTYSIIIMQIKE